MIALNLSDPLSISTFVDTVTRLPHLFELTAFSHNRWFPSQGDERGSAGPLRLSLVFISSETSLRRVMTTPNQPRKEMNLRGRAESPEQIFLESNGGSIDCVSLFRHIVSGPHLNSEQICSKLLSGIFVLPAVDQPTSDSLPSHTETHTNIKRIFQAVEPDLLILPHTGRRSYSSNFLPFSPSHSSSMSSDGIESLILLQSSQQMVPVLLSSTPPLFASSLQLISRSHPLALRALITSPPQQISLIVHWGSHLLLQLNALQEACHHIPLFHPPFPTSDSERGTIIKLFIIFQEPYHPLSTLPTQTKLTVALQSTQQSCQIPKTNIYFQGLSFTPPSSNSSSSPLALPSLMTDFVTALLSTQMIRSEDYVLYLSPNILFLHESLLLYLFLVTSQDQMICHSGHSQPTRGAETSERWINWNKSRCHVEGYRYLSLNGGQIYGAHLLVSPTFSPAVFHHT
jgi:hypothetical protein